MVMNSATPQALVIDSGSTNRAGVTVSLDAAGNATIVQRGAQRQDITLDAQICGQLMRDIQSAGTLSALPAQHCMKSVSFGSSLYVEVEGDRSPDLSCPEQQDPRAASLQKDARAVLQAVQKLSVTRVRPVRPVKPQ